MGALRHFVTENAACPSVVRCTWRRRQTARHAAGPAPRSSPLSQRGAEQSCVEHWHHASR